jgi:hypothetical protein
MSKGRPKPGASPLRILAITQGLWGERIAEHIKTTAPPHWSMDSWGVQRALPQIIDDPEDFLPAVLPEVDLILSLGEVGGLAQLIPAVASRTGAQAVIAPIDRQEALPSGLARQLQTWLEQIDVACICPKPFCSLSESSYNRSPRTQSYDHPTIRRFAEYFGRPEFEVSVEDGYIVAIEVTRDSACGCAHHVAENLVGTPVYEAIEKAGLLHHHFPCLASMGKDVDYNDTLMHVSGNFLKDSLKEELKPHLSIVYISPHGRVDDEG